MSLGVIAALLILLLPLPFLAIHRFILFALLPVVFFIYTIFDKKTVNVKITTIDIATGIFFTLGILSYGWATNGALVWYPAFNFLGLALWVILFRTCINQTIFQQYLPIVFLSLFCVILLYIVLIVGIVEIKLSTPTLWNKYFGYNGNYMPTYLLALFPFFLFYESTKIPYLNILKLISTTFILFLIYKTSAKGAAVIFFVLMMYYFWSTYSRKYFWCLVGILTFIFICLSSLYLFDETILHKILGLKKIRFFDSARFYMIQGSITTFLENPLIGIGLGNWHIDVYKNITNIKGFNVVNFVRTSNHNLYSQHLVELGLIGFFVFYYPFIYVMKDSGKKKLTNFQKAAYACIFVYLVASIFYRDANMYEEHFSSIQLLAFCAFGILTAKHNFYNINNNLAKYFLLLLGLACFSWFIYYHQTAKVYRMALALPKEDVRATQLLESIYHPIFKTTHDYRGNAGANQSLSLLLAERYQIQQIDDKTEEYFQKALKYAPNDEYIHMAYARFLLRSKNKPMEAKKHLLFVHNIQPDYLEANALLAEIAIDEKAYSMARAYMNTRYFRLMRRTQLEYLEKRLYSSAYLDKLLKLTALQKEQLVNPFREIRVSLQTLKPKILQLEEKGDAKKIKALSAEINTELKKQKLEDILFHILSDKQHLKYLQDKLYSIYKNYRWGPVVALTRLLLLNEKQQEAILELYLNIDVELKDIALRIELPEIKNNKEIKEKYYRKRDSLNLALESGFFQVLSTRQYEIYKKNKLYKIFDTKFSKKLELIEAASLRVRELFVEYHYNKSLMMNEEGINDLSMIVHQEKFQRELKIILDKQQFATFYKVLEKVDEDWK